MKLAYVGCSVAKGTTDWKDPAGNRYRLDQYGAGTLREIACTDPLVVRERYGVPDNIYWVDWTPGWTAGTMTIIPEMLRYFKKLPARNTGQGTRARQTRTSEEMAAEIMR